MKRLLLPCLVVLVSLGAARGAGAADERDREGWVVVAVGNETEVAAVTWPLAQAVYASPRLRPLHLREDEARALAGEAPKDPSPRLRDLYETRAALRGEDSTSVRLLASLAQTLGVRGFITVRVAQGTLAPSSGPSDAGSDADATAQASTASEPKTTMTASARIFLAETQTFDAAAYAPEGSLENPSWARATTSIERAFGRAPKVAPVSAAPAGPAAKGSPFYKSFWFWGAMGAAALLGGTAFLLTRDSDPTSVHLRAEVPR